MIIFQNSSAEKRRKNMFYISKYIYLIYNVFGELWRPLLLFFLPLYIVTIIAVLQLLTMLMLLCTFSHLSLRRGFFFFFFFLHFIHRFRCSFNESDMNFNIFIRSIQSHKANKFEFQECAFAMTCYFAYVEFSVYAMI